MFWTFNGLQKPRPLFLRLISASRKKIPLVPDHLRQMQYNIHVLSEECIELAASISFKFKNEVFVFNCPENTQRLLGASRIRLSKPVSVYLTRLTWRKAGGLPGFLLSMNTVSPRTFVTGPTKTKSLISSLRLITPENNMCVVPRDIEMPANPHENACPTIPALSEESLAVTPVFLVPDPGFPPDSCESQRPAKLPKTDSSDFTIAYICDGPSKKGAFNVEKAVSSGIKKSEFSKFFKENILTLSDGKTLTPDDFRAEPIPATKFLILDLPDKRYIKACLNHPSISTILDEELIVFHMLGEKIIDSVEFKDFVQKFTTKSRHHIFSPETGAHSVNFKYAADKVNRLCVDCPSFFTKYQSFEPTSFSLPENCVICKQADNYTIAPKYKIESKVTSLSEDTEIQWGLAAPKRSSPFLSNPRDFVLMPLGTGSAMPSSLRGLSSALLSMNDGCVLLDCGEGTLYQLYRIFPLKKEDGDHWIHERHPTIDKVLDGIRVIYVSHTHADHHMGLNGLLSQINHTVLVIGPHKLLKFLSETRSMHQTMLAKIVFIPSDSLKFTGGSRNDLKYLYDMIPSKLCTKLREEDVNFIKKIKISTIRVPHIPDSHGVFICDDSHSMVYSGDTRPSENLVKLGKELGPTDVLLHEATFASSMKADAVAKAHSTVGEAIQIFNQMDAKNLLLTHFSQRYKGLPDSFETKGDPRISFAHDLAIYPFSQAHFYSQDTRAVFKQDSFIDLSAFKGESL